MGHLYSVWDRVCPLLRECSEFWMVWMFVSFSHGSELCTEAAFKRHRAENSSAFRALQHQRATRPPCSSLQTQLYSGWVRAWPPTLWRACVGTRLTWACVAQRRRVGLWRHGDGNSSRNEFELRERLRLGRTCNGKTRVVMLFSFLTSVGSFSWSEVNTWATTSALVIAHSAQPLAVSFISGLDVFKDALLLFPVAKTVDFCRTCDVAELSFNSKLSYLRT